MTRHAAQAVLAAPAAARPVRGLLQRKCACGNHTVAGGTCAECTEEKSVLQRRASHRGHDGSVPPIVHDVLRSPGQPLDAAARTFMEPRFAQNFTRLPPPTAASRASHDLAIGAPNHPTEAEADRIAERVASDSEPRTLRRSSDFGHVRVHADPKAAESARAVDALAYTVGPHVVFGPGSYAPHTSDGRRLLAHELTHVVQQADAHGLDRKVLQRKGGTVGGFFRNIGRSIASIFTDELDFDDAELQAYLKIIDAGSIEDDYHSDDKARAVVRRWMAGAAGFALTRERKALLIEEMVTGFAGDDDEAAILNLLAGSPDPELTYIFGKVTPARLRKAIDFEEHKQLEDILKGWTARTGALPAKDLFAGTHQVTATQQANVEKALNPTTTVVGGVVVEPPAMTGTGVGGTFESEMLTMLNDNVGGWAAQFRAMKAKPGQPAFPVSKADPIADAAQAETERYFAPYIRVASRAAAETYHPATYSLRTKIGDESTRPIAMPDRRGWLNYWMTLTECRSSPCGQGILNAHSYLGSRDAGEFNRVRDIYLADPAHVTDVDDAIHGWPAEAGTGTVFIQPYKDVSNEDKDRSERWDLFTTLIHELMHVLMHPNFGAAANVIGGTARKILVEGLAEVMRTELWSGPGDLRGRLATPAMAPRREQVEGKRYDYKADVVQDHGYYAEMADAEKIDTEVGHDNAKAAFFLGHVELLGLGAGTRTEGGSLSGVASFEPDDTRDARVIVTSPGDTYAGLLDRSGAASGALLDDATGAPLPVGGAIAAGTRVRIPGIRWVRAITNDTLGGVAQQHDVSVAALAKANNFAPGAPPSTPLIVGSRVLIPIH